MTKKPFYITTTIPYVNATPHIGHGLEYIQADAMARYQRLLGKDVYFLTGSDENSLKNVQAAEKLGKPVKEFVDEHAEYFKELKDVLNISFDDFIRTTEERHFLGAQKFWNACNKDDIYKKEYKGLYCVGCEAFYNEDELVGGKCPDHKKELEVIEEENYFFKLSNYQNKIAELIESDAIKLVPEFRKNEALAFVKRGLQDFSISRSYKRAHGWGVPVPEDEEQIMYVWYDALANYISALDYENEGELYKKYWIQNCENREVVHVLGKGVSRFHAIYWIGMLLSAGIPLPTEEFIHGYITVDGEKMSKSIGNVLNPKNVVEKYGIDATRFYFLGAISAYKDSDYSADRFEEFYTAHLVNGIGNLTSRILTMLEKYSENKIPNQAVDIFETNVFWNKYQKLIEEYQFDKVVKIICELVGNVDQIISEEKPWEKARNGENIDQLLYQLAEGLRHIALALLPIIPDTSKKIFNQLGYSDELVDSFILGKEKEWGRLESRALIKKGEILFERLGK